MQEFHGIMEIPITESDAEQNHVRAALAPDPLYQKWGLQISLYVKKELIRDSQYAPVV